MAVQTDFIMAVNQIAAERGINVKEVLDAIKDAIRTGYRSDYPDEEETTLNVEISEEDGMITVYADKEVVNKVTNKVTQISLADAQRLEPKLRLGDHVEVDVTPDGDFGRVAAQSAKQVILQKIREAEKETVLKEFADRIGEIETAIVQRMDGDSVLWEVRKAVGVMPKSERVPTEFYKSGFRHKVLIKEITNDARGRELIVSRSDAKFLNALFELEIPELVSGSIEIKEIARESGSRSKVAVSSNTEGIDPIGSCVGQKGVRINAIMNELKIGYSEEKIDIILWDPSTKQFISNALSPAEVIKVEVVDEKGKVMRVIVPDDQLSLAIGKEGQNVRLAAKLTGWKIDIQGETIKVDSEYVKPSSTDVKTASGGLSQIQELGLGSRIERALDKAGIETVSELSEKIANNEKLAGVGDASLEKIKAVLK